MEQTRPSCSFGNLTGKFSKCLGTIFLIGK